MAEKGNTMSINGIEITEIKISPTKSEGSNVKALARIVLNGQLCINGIRIVKGKFGPFISFPGTFDKKSGKGYQLAHPVTRALQEYLSERILRQWQHTVEQFEVAV